MASILMVSPVVAAALVMSAVLSWLTAPPVAAACDCLCVDGQRMTVCTTAEELQSSPGLCRFRPDLQCPAVAPDGPRRTYQAPMDGVSGCRDARVESPATGQQIMARVCDVRPGG